MQKQVVNDFIKFYKEKPKVFAAFITRTRDGKYCIARHFHTNIESFKFEYYFPELYEKEASNSEILQQQVCSKEDNSMSYYLDILKQAEQQLHQQSVENEFEEESISTVSLIQKNINTLAKPDLASLIQELLYSINNPA